MEKSQMSVVGGGGYDEIKNDLVERAIAMIREHGLSQKVATKLFRDAWLSIESARPFREDPEVYIAARLQEQVLRYIELGFHDAAGFSQDGFRAALSPLLRKTVAFFAPPAEYPIMRGEFSVLLVLPPEWVSLRKQIASICGIKWELLHGDMADHLSAVSRAPEVAEHGKPAPREPYVLVGIDGGRGLKEHSLLGANNKLKKSDRTYFSAHQLVQLLAIRPDWLAAQSATIALGEKYEKDYLGFAAQPGRPPELRVFGAPSAHSCVGVAKPYYTKMITTP